MRVARSTNHVLFYLVQIPKSNSLKSTSSSAVRAVQLRRSGQLHKKKYLYIKKKKYSNSLSSQLHL